MTSCNVRCNVTREGAEVAALAGHSGVPERGPGLSRDPGPALPSPRPAGSSGAAGEPRLPPDRHLSIPATARGQQGRGQRWQSLSGGSCRHGILLPERPWDSPGPVCVNSDSNSDYILKKKKYCSGGQAF